MFRLVDPNRKGVRTAVQDWLHTAARSEPHHTTRLSKIATENIRVSSNQTFVGYIVECIANLLIRDSLVAIAIIAIHFH